MGFSAPRRPTAELSLRVRALRLLARRDHTQQELRTKLIAQLKSAQTRARKAQAAQSGADASPQPPSAHAHTPDIAQELDALMHWLHQRGYLNDERCAESLAHQRSARFGSARIAAELRQRGVDAEIVRRTRDALRSDDFERALALWQRKFGTPAHDPKERARQLRFLAARGFDADIALRVLRAGSTSA